MSAATGADVPTGWRGLPATVQILVLARAVNRLGAFTLPFLAVVLVLDFGASIGQAGYLLAAFGLATIPSRLVGGRLADRIGAKATILVGLAGTAASQLCIAGSRTLLQATVAVVALGLVFEVYEPPSQAIIADVTPADQRPLAYGLLGAAMAAAGMGAGLLAALLSSVNVRYLFVVDAATGMACACVVTAFLPWTDGDRRPEAAAVSAWADRRLLSMLATGTVFAVIYLQLTIALPLTLAERSLSTSLIGVLLTLSATTMVLGQPLLARPRMHSLDDFSAMVLGYTILAAGLLLNGFATTAPGFVVATVIWSLGDLILLGRAHAIVAGIAPKTARGQYLAVYGTSWGVAGIGAPVLGTQLLDHGGPRLVWVTAATLCLALAAVQPALRKRARDPLDHMNGIPTVGISGVPDPLPDGLAVVDVREPVEWHYGHIEGAIHIPLGELTGRLDDVPEGQTLVVCKVGARSAQAAMWLSQQGRDAVNLDGGLLDWEAAGRALVSETGQPPIVV